MLLKKITEQELEFIECWHLPRCLVECLFSNFDNQVEFDEDKFGELRLYQLPLISDEPLVDFETTAKYHNLSKKEAFNLRKNTGDIYNFGGRKYGKTLVTEKLDIPISMLHDSGFQCACASDDADHLYSVLDVIKQAIENHPILKAWRQKTQGKPNWQTIAKNGWHLFGINMNIKGKSPGDHFFGKHVRKLWIEEASKETEEVYNKRKESLSEFGAIMRISGMTDFTKHSPAGLAFYNMDNKEKVANLPQMVNPCWDEKEKRDRIEFYGGESSNNYRVYVLGEVLEDGVSEFDMERIRPYYLKKKSIKRFELKKEQFSNFRDLVIVARPQSADQVLICSDIGDGAGGSDIIVLSKKEGVYTYLYNILLYNMTEDEQEEIFEYLIQQLKADIIAFDCGDGTGRGLYHRFEKKYPKENLIWYQGQKKIEVGFEKDEKGDVKTVKGKPVYHEEWMSEWAVRRLKVLLYEGKIRISKDYKLDKQLNSVVSMTSGSRKVYACINNTGDHLFDAFKVFAIAEWLVGDNLNISGLNVLDWGTGVSSWSTKKNEDGIEEKING